MSATSQSISPRKWAMYALYSLIWHALWTLIVGFLDPNDPGKPWLMPLYACLVVPALLTIMYHFISVIFDVIKGKYGSGRGMKLAGIFFLGPIVTGYLAWNYQRYGWKC